MAAATRSPLPILGSRRRDESAPPSDERAPQQQRADETSNLCAKVRSPSAPRHLTVHKPRVPVHQTRAETQMARAAYAPKSLERSRLVQEEQMRSLMKELLMAKTIWELQTEYSRLT